MTRLSYTNVRNFVMGNMPLLTVLLIFMGIVKQMAYYFVFHIFILDYISASEAILSSVIPLIIILLSGCFGGYITIYFIILPVFSSKKYKSISNEETRDGMQLFEAACRLTFRFIYFIVIIIAIFVNKIVTQYVWMISTFLLVSLTLLRYGVKYALYLSYAKEKEGGWKVSKAEDVSNAERLDAIQSQENFLEGSKFPAYKVLALVIPLLILQYSTMHALAVKNEHHQSSANIRLKDIPAIETSDSLIYVGRVEKFTFLFNKISSLPTIISNEQILTVQWKPIASIPNP